MSYLVLSGLSKHYGATPALADVALDVPFGSRTAIVGPSGSGKSTLLRLVAGFETADAGRIVLDGEVLADGAGSVPAHRRSVGFVTQDGSLFPHLSVGDNVSFGLDRGLPGRRQAVLDLLDLVELDRSVLARRPHELSGGQQQRVALARALARRPKLMLFDEPFSALDAGLRESMRKAVLEVLRRAEITALLVTHDQAEALSFADQIAILRNGRLVQVGNPQELYFAPSSPFTAAFLGDANILPATIGEGWVECALGRVRADTGGRTGRATIMLRPEQLRLEPPARQGPDPQDGQPAEVGIVTGLEFGGAISRATVSLLRPNGGGAPAELVAAVSSAAPPAIGAEVAIKIWGAPHLFAE